MEQKLRTVKKHIDDQTRALFTACDLYQMLQTANGAYGDRVASLHEKFMANLNRWDPEGLLRGQVDYATKLANWPGELLYEEMHKLFSLCDTIQALEGLGVEPRPELAESYAAAVRNRFTREPHKARLVAEDKLETWKAGFWWYAENLPKY